MSVTSNTVPAGDNDDNTIGVKQCNDDNDENTAGGRAGEMQRNQLDRQQWAGDNTFSPIALRKVFSIALGKV